MSYVVERLAQIAYQEDSEIRRKKIDFFAGAIGYFADVQRDRASSSYSHFEIHDE